MSTRDLCLGAAIAIIGHAYAPEIIQVLQWPTTYSSANILVSPLGLHSGYTFEAGSVPPIVQCPTFESNSIATLPQSPTIVVIPMLPWGWELAPPMSLPQPALPDRIKI